MLGLDGAWHTGTILLARTNSNLLDQAELYH
jgi:hypothetical protein